MLLMSSYEKHRQPYRAYQGSIWARSCFSGTTINLHVYRFTFPDAGCQTLGAANARAREALAERNQIARPKLRELRKDIDNILSTISEQTRHNGFGAILDLPNSILTAIFSEASRPVPPPCGGDKIPPTRHPFLLIFICHGLIYTAYCISPPKYVDIFRSPFGSHKPALISEIQLFLVGNCGEILILGLSQSSWLWNMLTEQKPF